MIPCVHFLVQPVGRQVMDYVSHELNTVWHELLHLWKTFLECLFGGGDSTVSEIHSDLVLGMYALCHLYCSMACTM